MLRLALIAVIFLFVAIVAFSLRGSLAIGPSRIQPAAQRRWKLVVTRPGVTGLAAGTEFVLAGAMVIGRDARSGITLPDDSVSTRHAQLERVRAGWKCQTRNHQRQSRQRAPDRCERVLVRGRESLLWQRGTRLVGECASSRSSSRPAEQN